MGSPASAPQQLPSIAVVMDERLSREKRALLSRVVYACRQCAQVELIDGQISEADLVARLQSQVFGLVLVPWYRYLAWKRVEALYGLTRTSGPTFAGYFCDPLEPYEVGGVPDQLRALLLDFSRLNQSEILTLLKAIVQERARAGIRPLLRDGTPIHFESWFQNTSEGARAELVLGLPDVRALTWLEGRRNAVRVALAALWSLIYDEGPGKLEFANALAPKAPRAYFQVGADESALLLRLYFSMPSWTPKDALEAFWPDPHRPARASQLLLRAADFTRVHAISGSSEVEVVAGFLPPGATSRPATSLRTLWIEPLAPHLVLEPPFEAPSPANHLVALPPRGEPLAVLGSGPAPLPRPAAAGDVPTTISAVPTTGAPALEAATQLRELKARLAERDRLITELKSGGVGSAAPLPPPDAEAILESFQHHFFETRFRIRQLEAQIGELESRGAPAPEVEALRQRVQQLMVREQGWLRKLATTLEAYREVKRPKGA